ncbi:MAG: hypothetical protein ABI959_00500 [Candidatus Dormiibacterota bacterium]
MVIMIVPLAVAGATPFSLNTRAAGEGVVAGVVTTGLGDGEGDGEEPVSVLPQAAAVTAIAASATHLLIPGHPLQLCTQLPMKVT